jgi:hypothetical protein
MAPYVPVQDLPFLTQFIGVLQESLSISGQGLTTMESAHQTGAAAKPLVGYFRVLVMDLDGNDILVGLKLDTVPIAQRELKGMLLVVDLGMGHIAAVVTNQLRQLCIGDTVDHVLSKARNLEHIWSNLDCSCFNETVAVANLGSGVNVQAQSLKEIWGVEENGITLTVV